MGNEVVATGTRSPSSLETGIVNFGAYLGAAIGASLGLSAGGTPGGGAGAAAGYNLGESAVQSVFDQGYAIANLSAAGRASMVEEANNFWDQSGCSNQCPW